MDKYILNVDISLLLPAVVIFILLGLHCYFFRGARLTFTFFGSALLLSFGREVVFGFLSRLTGKPPYLVLGTPFKIFHLPMVLYIGWAITFYLSWYLAERILKRIGCLSDRIFPTITWSILITGGISYCVEATAIRVGWWAWSFPDPRLKDFLVAPFSAFEGWSAETALFLLIFFLFECSKYRGQWWRVFLYPLIFNLLINAITYCIVLSSPRNFDAIRNINIFMMIFDSTRILLPVILMFFWSISFKYERLNKRNSRIGLFLYDAIPLFALIFILSACIGIDIIVLKEPYLIFSALPLIFLLLFSSRKVPAIFISFSAFILLIIGNKLAYIIFLPVAIFFAFLGFERLRDKYNFNLAKY